MADERIVSSHCGFFFFLFVCLIALLLLLLVFFFDLVSLSLLCLWPGVVKIWSFWCWSLDFWIQKYECEMS